VVGDGEVLVAQRLGGTGHGLDVVVPVGRRRVHVDVAPQVAAIDERRKAPLAGRLDLARCSRNSGGTNGRSSAA